MHLHVVVYDQHSNHSIYIVRGKWVTIKKKYPLYSSASVRVFGKSCSFCALTFHSNDVTSLVAFLWFSMSLNWCCNTTGVPTPESLNGHNLAVPSPDLINKHTWTFSNYFIKTVIFKTVSHTKIPLHVNKTKKQCQQ